MKLTGAPGRLPRSGFRVRDDGPMSTTARTARARTVDASGTQRPVGPQQWLSGLVAAGQALVLSLSMVILPPVVAFLVSSSGAAEGTGWGRSVTVGASLWLLGHGVPLKTGGGLITLVPLGITALALFSCYASARRSAHATRSAWLTGTVGYGLVVLGVGLLAGATTTPGLVVAALGGMVVGALGLGCGILARPDAPRLADLAGRIPSIPRAVRLGMRGGALGVCLLVVVAGLMVMLWVIAGRATSADIVTGLAPGIAGGAILAAAQVTLVPNLVVWAMSWIAGPGFAIGADTSYTSTATRPGILPAVPLLGALPGDSWTNAATALAPAVVILLGVVVGVFVVRRTPNGTRIGWAEAGWSTLGIAVAAFAVTGCLAGLASGSVGAMTDVGTNALLTATVVAGELAVGGGVALAWTAADVPTILSSRKTADSSTDET